jgi:pseudaminic acid cytidylyltransferase
MTICIIPARGGSKRIPKKNIKLFYGRPMIEWSISAAISSKIFSKIIVSTEDSEIAEIATLAGAEVPFVRPQELSDDYTTTGKVMAHACNWLKNQNLESKFICCLYPTSPFVLPDDLVDALSILKKGKWKYVFSVGEYSSSVYRSFSQELSGGVKMLFPDYFSARSQDLSPIYHDAGMFYMGLFDAWVKNLPVFNNYAFPYVIPTYRLQDIDTHEDWQRAEILAKAIF